jgi:hypothetical protein
VLIIHIQHTETGVLFDGVRTQAVLLQELEKFVDNLPDRVKLDEIRPQMRGIIKKVKE